MPVPMSSLSLRCHQILTVGLATALVATAVSPLSTANLSDQVTVPIVSAEVSPVEDLRISETAFAAIRKPPGKGPFPAIVFLHGGLGHASLANLRQGAVDGPTQARFLAWGFATVNATRRDIHGDPQDRGVVEDTVAIVSAVKKLPYVDPASVVLYGGSGGGTLAIEVASETDLAAVAAGEPATIIYMGLFTKADRGGNQLISANSLQRYRNASLKELYTAESRLHTRGKLTGIRCPILIMHGDQHWLKRFNLEVLVPEMQGLGKAVQVEVYPGEDHGFYWGRTPNPDMGLKANKDALEFFQGFLKTQPRALAATLIEQVPAQPRERARDGERANR